MLRPGFDLCSFIHLLFKKKSFNVFRDSCNTHSGWEKNGLACRSGFHLSNNWQRAFSEFFFSLTQTHTRARSHTHTNTSFSGRGRWIEGDGGKAARPTLTIQLFYQIFWKCLLNWWALTSVLRFFLLLVFHLVFHPILIAAGAECISMKITV